MVDNIPSTDAGKAREGLIDELETINNYEEMASETSDPKLKAQFEEITDDERVHVGNFAEMVSEKDPKAEPMMKEGLKEAKEFEKSYRLYSFQEMMCGASHFEKVGTNDPDKTYGGVIGENIYRGRKDMPYWFSGQRLRNTRGSRKLKEGDVNLGTRNADISHKRYPYSRMQWMEAIALGAAHPLTANDVYGEADYFEKDETGTYRPKDDIAFVEGPDGEYYLARLDADDEKYHQIIRKKDGSGSYMDFYMTPKTTEHYSKYSPSIVTRKIAIQNYNAFRKRMAARNRDGNKGGKRNVNFWGTNEFNDFETDWEKEYGVDTQGETDSRFKRARYNSPEFDDFALASGVLKMPLKAYMSLEEDTKDNVDELTSYLEKEIFGEVSDLTDPEVATAVRQKIAKDIYENPQKYIGRMSYLMDNVDDMVNQAVQNDPGFANEISRQVKSVKRIAKPDEYRAAMEEGRKNFKPRAVLDKNGNPILDAKGNPLMTMSTYDLYAALDKNAAEERYAIQHHRPFPNDPKYDPNAGRPSSDFRAIGDGTAVKTVNIGTEKTAPPEALNDLILATQDHAEQQLKNQGRAPQFKGSVPRTDDDTPTYGVEVTGTTNAEVTDDRSPGGGGANRSRARQGSKSGSKTEEGTSDIKRGSKKKSGSKKEGASDTKSGSKKEGASDTKSGTDTYRTTADELSSNPNRARKQLKELAEKTSGEKEPTTTTAKSASFEEMLKSANARQWEEKGLPSGSMEATLPAYYRTVTIGSDRDAVNVYEHKKMPVGGDGINVKKVPGIGPKMSEKGDNMEPNEKAEPVRKTAGIREMIARNCFEKTGRIPDVEFIDTYQFQKTPTYVPESDAAKLAFHDELSSKNLDKKEYPTARRYAQTARHHMAREALDNQNDLGPEADSSTEHLREISPYPIDDTVIMNTATDDGEIDPSKMGFTTYHNDDLEFHTPKAENDIHGMRMVDAFSRSPEAYGGHHNSRKELKKLDKPDLMESLREYLKDNPNASEEEMTGFINDFKKKYRTN